MNRRVVAAVSNATSKNKLQGDTGSENKIKGGQATEVHEYPWQARLDIMAKNGKEGMCGGTLMTEKWIMTAAHCT